MEGCSTLLNTLSQSDMLQGIFKLKLEKIPNQYQILPDHGLDPEEFWKLKFFKILPKICMIKNSNAYANTKDGPLLQMEDMKNQPF